MAAVSKLLTGSGFPSRLILRSNDDAPLGSLDAMTNIPTISAGMSDEPLPRRDPILIVLALLANGTAITCLLLAFRDDQPIIAAYGVFRMAASYGLFRTKTYGLKLERFSAFLWIAIPVVVILLSGFFSPPTHLPFIILSAAFSIGELWYLGRAELKAKFAKRSVKTASTLRATLGWTCGQLALLLYLHLTLPPLPSIILFDSAYQRSLQHRTMADMKTIATALEARAVDVNDYPFAASIDAIAAKLSPTYLKQVPLRDGWGNRWRYEAWKVDPKAHGRDYYVIVSAGKDAQFESADPKLMEAFVRANKAGQLSTFTPKETTNFDCDIVYSTGSFIQYPQGLSPPTSPW